MTINYFFNKDSIFYGYLNFFYKSQYKKMVKEILHILPLKFLFRHILSLCSLHINYTTLF